MGTYCDALDDQAVEEKAWDLAIADGNSDPDRMTYENDGGVIMPWGPVWARYIQDAIEALASGALSAHAKCNAPNEKR